MYASEIKLRVYMHPTPRIALLCSVGWLVTKFCSASGCFGNHFLGRRTILCVLATAPIGVFNRWHRWSAPVKNT